MADIRLVYGNALSFSSQSNMNNLASGSQASIGILDNTTMLYLDYIVEVTIADIVEAGNKQALIYAIDSVDGTNFSDATNVGNMRFIGGIDLVGVGPHRSSAMLVAAAFGGVFPPAVQIVVKNDSGVSFAASGNTAQYRSISATVT